MSWWDVKTYSRFMTPETMRAGDIVVQLRDGRLFLIGSGGVFHALHWWDHLLYVVLG
jgi:hypothetical protein